MKAQIVPSLGYSENAGSVHDQGEAVVAIGNQRLGANDPRSAQPSDQQLRFRQDVGCEARCGRLSFPCLDLRLQHPAAIEIAKERDAFVFWNFVRRNIENGKIKLAVHCNLPTDEQARPHAVVSSHSRLMPSRHPFAALAALSLFRSAYTKVADAARPTFGGHPEAQLITMD
nr:hypothetical protein [Bradyrhizobium sp. 21]